MGVVSRLWPDAFLISALDGGVPPGKEPLVIFTVETGADSERDICTIARNVLMTLLSWLHRLYASLNGNRIVDDDMGNVWEEAVSPF